MNVNFNYVCAYLLVFRRLEVHTHYQNPHFIFSEGTSKFEAKSQNSGTNRINLTQGKIITTQF